MVGIIFAQVWTKVYIRTKDADTRATFLMSGFFKNSILNDN